MGALTKEMLEELLPGVTVTVSTEGHVEYVFEKDGQVTQLHAEMPLSEDFRYNIANYVKKMLKNY